MREALRDGISKIRIFGLIITYAKGYYCKEDFI